MVQVKYALITCNTNTEIPNLTFEASYILSATVNFSEYQNIVVWLEKLKKNVIYMHKTMKYVHN